MGTARENAKDLIEQALATDVRGDTREYLTKALRSLTGTTAAMTKLHYDNLAVGAKAHDPDRPGLVMRYGKRTGKVWLYRHTDSQSGKKVEKQFGTYPALSLAEARVKWSELREGVQSGVTPAPAPASLTMGELVQKYLDEYARPTKRSWRMDETYLSKQILQHYADLPATEFTPEHVRRILAPIAEKTPREAEKVRATISGMFNVATRGSKKIGNLSGSTWLPPTTMNPATSVLLPERQTRNHTPTTAELRTLWQALAAEGDLGQAIRLQALTCARVTEVTSLPWAEIDLQAGTWMLPAERSKNGHAHLVMLPDAAIEILESRKRAGDFVFPGGRGAEHINRNAVGRVFQRIRKEHGLPELFTSHSLRHACLTWLAENQSGKEIRDRISNHVENTSSDSIYNAASLNKPAREWLQRWSEYLVDLR